MKVRITNRCDDLPVPARSSPQASGFDLHAAVENDVSLAPGERVLIPTGITIELPAGYEGQVRPRSGLAIKHGISVVNSPGTIDADYRGEVSVVLINLGSQTFTVRRGDRIAQLVIAAVETCELEVVTELSETTRGAGGFGSTGV